MLQVDRAGERGQHRQLRGGASQGWGTWPRRGIGVDDQRGPLVDRYRAAGLTDVTVRTYPDGRHEILNETNKQEVIAELAGWLDRVLADSGRAS